MQKIIDMWSVIASFIGTFLEDARLSYFNDTGVMSLLLYLFPCSNKL